MLIAHDKGVDYKAIAAKLERAAQQLAGSDDDRAARLKRLAAMIREEQQLPSEFGDNFNT